MFDRAVEKGSMQQSDVSAAMARIEVIGGIPALASCDLVVEAVIEDLDLKKQLFKELEAVVAPECILASNTSSLSITTIAAGATYPGRIAGFHFFNPVPLMKLVEVIDGLLTEKSVGDALMEVGRIMGREPVRVKDAPGFLVNQVGRAYTLESAHLVSEGVGSFAEVDAVMRDIAGFRMGPFELLDLVGLDVNHPATEMIYNQFYHEPRYRPSVMMQSRLDAGVLGRKTGQGFYRYVDGKPEALPASPCPSGRAESIWVSDAEPWGAKKLRECLEGMGISLETSERPSDRALCLVTPLGEDATHAALAQGLDPKRTIAVDTLFSLSKRRTCMATPVTEPAYRAAAHALLSGDGVPVTVLSDSPGFITQRVVAMIVNIGASIAQLRTAQPADIDKAVKLGLGYPHGPLGFGDFLGPHRILQILRNMYEMYGDPRYRPSLWLTRRAKLGVSLMTPD
jgi:3-hydroxybutyryl-CoA dehydrogenase